MSDEGRCGIVICLLFVNSLAFGGVVGWGSNQSGQLDVPLAPPVSRSAWLGNTVTFEIVVEGSGLQYQWRFNGADLAGETNAQLTIANATWASAGSYSVAVSNPFGSEISQPAQLSLTQMPLGE